MLRYKLGCGAKIRFWKDIWIGDIPLMDRYIRLFRLDPDPNCVVIDRFVNGEWNLKWSRPIVSGRNLDYLISLNSDLEQISSFIGRDDVRWELGNDATFTVKETREHIDDNILPTLDAPTISCISIPRKVNIFLWRLRLDQGSKRRAMAALRRR
nr:RNA-directed DNA polymerase, eukaryota [Tanacetum cinerariifolium]